MIVEIRVGENVTGSRYISGIHVFCFLVALGEEATSQGFREVRYLEDLEASLGIGVCMLVE